MPPWRWVLLSVLLAAGSPAADGSGPGWLADVRDAAYAVARANGDDPELQAAQLELQRARAGGLPSLRLAERSRLALDGGFGVGLDARLRIPLVAPDVAAEVRLAEVRLQWSARAVAAARRQQLHASLAHALAVLAAEARVRALEALQLALRRAPDVSSSPRDPSGLEARTRLDARLLADRLEAQRREARQLRQALARALGVTAQDLDAGIPGVSGPGPSHPGASEPGPSTAEARGDDPSGPRPEGERFAPPPYGTRVSRYDPARCVLASDDVALARLAASEQRAAETGRWAQAATRIDLELGGGVDVGDGAALGTGDARAQLRVSLSVRLPPWSPTTGAATLAAGSAGLQQAITLAWPNRERAAPPESGQGPDGAAPDGLNAADPTAADPTAEAERDLLERLAALRGQEDDLLRRRALLTSALASIDGDGLTSAYLRATLRLQLADVEQALGLTRLDAALACGALPP